jgi:hypothetical protein
VTNVLLLADEPAETNSNKGAKAATRRILTKIQEYCNQVGVKTHWALYQKEQFTALVDRVSQLVDLLVKEFPPRRQQFLETQQRSMSQLEASDLSKDGLRALLQICDPILQQAVSAEATKNGLVFQDNVIEGVGTSGRIGFEYAADYTGRIPDNGATMWVGNIVRGAARGQIGSKYGGQGI